MNLLINLLMMMSLNRHLLESLLGNELLLLLLLHGRGRF